MIRRKASQVIRLPDSCPKPFGEAVWERTSFVEFAFPVRSMSGRVRTGGEDWVYMVRRGQSLRRRFVQPADPRSSAQVEHRQRFGVAKRAWAGLSESQRKAWQEYASKQPPSANDGYNLYVKVQICRQAMGMALSQEAPAQPPPPEVISIEQLATSSDNSYAFRLEHDVADVTGMKVLVELSAAMPSTRRKPREVELRYACEQSARSYVDFCPSGQSIVVEQARYSVAEGQRYGVRLRLVSAEGVPGRPTTVDFIRSGLH